MLKKMHIVTTADNDSTIILVSGLKKEANNPDIVVPIVEMASKIQDGSGVPELAQRC
jgi:hypothetical protein